MSKKKYIFKQNQIINGNLTVQFPYLKIDHNEYYRVKNKVGKIYLMQLSDFISSEMDKNIPGQLLQESILRNTKHRNIIKLLYADNIKINKKMMRCLLYNFISGETIEDKLKRKPNWEIFEIIALIKEIAITIKYLLDLESPILYRNISHYTILLDYKSNNIHPIFIDFNKANYLKDQKHYDIKDEIKALMILFINIIKSDISIDQYYDIELNEIVKHAKNIKAPTSDYQLLKNLIINCLENISEKDNISKLINNLIKLVPQMAIENSNKNRVFSIDLNNESENKGFNQIIGMDNLKEMLNVDVIRALREKELYKKYGLSIPNGTLLYGPPGCGKTYIAEKLAEEMEFNFIKLIPSDIASIYIHGSQQIISQVFKEAEENSPTIIMIDEVDAFVPKRNHDLNQSHASEVNEFLAQMTNCSEKNIFVIMTTNCPEKIDNAILRTGRVDKKIYIPPPDFKARAGMFEYYLKNRPISSDIDYDLLSKLTEDYVSSDIKFIVDESARIALRNKSKIDKKTLEEVIKNVFPSISIDEVEKYKEFQITEKQDKTIGFKGSNHEK